MSDHVSYELVKETAVLQINDGKANALSHEVVQALDVGLNQAAKEAKAVAIVGKPGMLSAGFDLKVMGSSPQAMRALVTEGAELLLRLYTFPKPVVVACTGHAMAAGALLLLASDARIGIEGTFKIGLNEVSLGMPMPIFAVELATARLTPTFLERATAQSEIFDPESAVRAGFLDSLTDAESLVDNVVAKAGTLANLSAFAFEQTRRTLREERVRHIQETLKEDISGLTIG